jgi:peptidoglycan hydrolase-like protein with peptidoglycan-binding domain
MLAFAVLFGCSHGSSSSGGSASARSARSAEQQTAVVQPSDLSNEQVRIVQRALSDRGFALDLTGSFDERTQTALSDFQRARGLPATGNLNQPTVEALGLDPRDVMPVRGSNDAYGGKKDANPSSAEGAQGGDRDSSSTSPSYNPQR